MNLDHKMIHALDSSPQAVAVAATTKPAFPAKSELREFAGKTPYGRQKSDIRFRKGVYQIGKRAKLLSRY
jgi:hypothetical protein